MNLMGPTWWYADNIGQGSALEMCYYLGKLQEEHYLLSKPPKRKGEVDIMIKVPMLGYALLLYAVLNFQHWNLSQNSALQFCDYW